MGTGVEEGAADEVVAVGVFEGFGASEFECILGGARNVFETSRSHAPNAVGGVAGSARALCGLGDVFIVFTADRGIQEVVAVGHAEAGAEVFG